MRKTTEIKTCEFCGKEFNPLYGRPNQRFCSRVCYIQNRWGHSEKNFCGICGNPAVSTGKRIQKYCSWECAQIAKNGRKYPGRSNLATKPCEWCGEDVTRPASNFHSKIVFCGYDCMAEWQSEFKNGANHPRWKGGPPRTYGVGWKQARKDAMIKAGDVCEKCKKKKAKHIHHKLPIRYFKKKEDAHFPKNLIALCHSCHAIEHRRLADALPLLDLLKSER